jgi:hypothetical protein
MTAPVIHLTPEAQARSTPALEPGEVVLHRWLRYRRRAVTDTNRSA